MEIVSTKIRAVSQMDENLFAMIITENGGDQGPLKEAKDIRNQLITSRLTILKTLMINLIN